MSRDFLSESMHLGELNAICEKKLGKKDGNWLK